MKKITLLLFLILPILGFGQLTIPNATFDTDISGWINNGGTISWESADGHTANGSLELVATASNNRAQTSPNVTPLLGNYTVSSWVKGVAGTQFQLAVFQGASGNNEFSGIFTIDVADDGVWKQYQFTASDLKDVGSNVRLIAKTAGTFYFDDISVTQIITERNSYTFDTDDDVEFWNDVSGAITGPASGVLTFAPTANQFAKIRQEGHSINASTNSHIRIVVQNLSTNDDQLRIIVPGGGNLTFTITTSDASDQTYEEDLSGVTGWTGNINNLEIGFRDADNTSGVGKSSGTGNFLINSIEFYSPAPTSITTLAAGNWNATATWTGGVVPASGDNVQIDHAVSVNIDATINNVTVANGVQLKINKEKSLIINGNLVTDTAYTLLIDGDSDQFGSLIVNGSVTGNAKMRRFVKASPTNDLVSPPLQNGTFKQLEDSSARLLENPLNAGEHAFGPFDNTSTNDYVNYVDPTNDAVVLVSGKGYRAATDPTDEGTVTFKGNIPTSQVDISITDPTGGSPWNLIGNPYPSYLDFETFLNQLDADDVLDEMGSYLAIYGYDADDTDPTSSKWTIWDYNSAYTTDLIAPGQGFFVKAKSGAGTVLDDTQVSFTPAMRTIGTSDDFIAGRIDNSNLALAKLNLTNATSNYQTNIYFRDINTRGLDPGYDTGAFNAFGNDVEGIFTHLVEDNTGVELVNQSLPYVDLNNVVVPLGIKANQGVQISIGLDAASTVPAANFVYLEDNLTNTWTLLNTGDYTFTPSADISGTGRFYVHFSSTTLSTDDDSFSGLQIYADQPNKTVVVKGQLSNNTNISIFDMRGRKLLQQDLDHSTTTNFVDVNILSTGVYIVQLSNRSQNKTQKVIIK